MKDGTLFLLAFIAIIGWFVYANFKQKGELRKLADALKTIKIESDRTQSQALSERNTALKKVETAEFLIAKHLQEIRQESALLPSVVSLLESIEENIDLSQVKGLQAKKRPAVVAAQAVKDARAEAREYRTKSRILENQISLYEANAPWLRVLLDYSLQDINSGLALAAAEQGGAHSEDPARMYIPEIEWEKLTAQQRSQLALDRYFDSRHKNAWLAGIAYERYIGSEYEKDGYHVIYNGAVSGKEDQGLDLICKDGSLVALVQCKRLSPAKDIPVRENAVAQIYGSALFYAHKNQIDTSSVVPTIITSHILSKEARDFADALNVHVIEKKLYKKYPAIKCNVGKNREKIYHLPFDQQYDNVHIKINAGDRYATTIEEAEKFGFRRAYRWSGG